MRCCYFCFIESFEFWPRYVCVIYRERERANFSSSNLKFRSIPRLISLKDRERKNRLRKAATKKKMDGPEGKKKHLVNRACTDVGVLFYR